MSGGHRLLLLLSLLISELKSHRQGGQTPEVTTEVPGDALTGDAQPQVGHAPEQSSKGNVPFHAGQRCPQTGMDAMPKGEMASDRARKIQLLWLGKLALIVIRRVQEGEKDIPLLDLLPGELDVFGGKTRSRDSGWPAEAQQFFDRRGNQTEVGFELRQ